MKIALLVPAPFETLSGGYLYDRRILEGLRARGHDAQAVELPGRHPLPDAAAEAGARAALEAAPEDARLVVDGLGLPALRDHAGRLDAGADQAERDE